MRTPFAAALHFFNWRYLDLVMLLLLCSCTSQSNISTILPTTAPVIATVASEATNTIANPTIPPTRSFPPTKPALTLSPATPQSSKPPLAATKPPSPTFTSEVDATISPEPYKTSTATYVPAFTRPAVPTPGQEKAAQIIYASLPGDGGWCMADYRGSTAPYFMLYSDGQLLIQNSSEEPTWYSDKLLNKEDLTVMLKRIEKSGFFSAPGDGTMWEEDPIYRFPDDFEESQGAGTLSLEADKGDQQKQVTVYIPYRKYLVPEIAKALQIIEEFRPQNMKPFRPKYWVAWVSTEDPCSFYDQKVKPWPDSLPSMHAFLSGATEGQLVMEGTSHSNLYQLLGPKPNLFFVNEDGTSYYIYMRPLLPHEIPSDFCTESCY